MAMIVHLPVLLRRARSGARAVAVLALLLAGAARAAEPMIITSATKQFVARGLPQRSLLAGTSPQGVVYVDPGMLVVTCESVKRALQRELNWGGRWQGTVFINIHPVRFDREQPEIMPFRSPNGWSYRIDMPDEMEPRRLLENIVGVLLLEFAGRAASGQSLELPPWLVQGLTAHLMQGPLAGLALQARTLREISDQPQLLAARIERPPGADQRLRQTVQREGALSVDQLNWPEFAAGDAAGAAAYRDSAHLFVRELLRLRGGPDALSAMLAMLPEHLNWQTAFLRAYAPHFQRMLEVEKWWALSVAQLRTHENSVTWTPSEARQKLADALVTPMQWPASQGDLPQVTPVTLQTIIRDWDFKDQTALLETRIGQLRAARVRLPAGSAALADAYRGVLEKYLRTRERAWFSRTGRQAASSAVAQLDALDERRARLPGKVAAAGAVPAAGPVPLTAR